MERDDLYRLAENIKDMLIESGIEAKSFTMNILVTRTTYESIKEHFPIRSPIDVIAGISQGNDWSISVMHSIHQPESDDDNPVGQFDVT